MRRSLAIGCVATLLAISSSFADLVYFARGGEAQLTATTEGDEVHLETPDGPKTFPRIDFLAIVPTPGPDVEWPDRKEAAFKDGTVEARFLAGWWALENGLTREALAVFEDLRAVAANHGPTRRAVAMLDALKLPCTEPLLEPLQRCLRPLRFRELKSAHVVLLHQSGDVEARERLDVLERVVETFMLAFAVQGIELPAPRRRLVSVYFADRRDYVRFLRSVEAEAFVDTQGYYHPNLHAVFAYDTRSAEGQQTARRAIGNRKRDGVARSELARPSLLLDLDWRTTDLGIAAHETIHQLTIDTGLAPHFDDFPRWLHEGLAAQFEVVRGGRWAGFGRANDRRLPDWRSIHPSPRLAPLLRDSGFGHGYQRDLYARSWALVFYLRKTHPREFLAFLDFLRTPSPNSSSPSDRNFEAFRSAFGNDMGQLESSWIHYLASLKTPLEAARPAAPASRSRDEVSTTKRRLVVDDPAH